MVYCIGMTSKQDIHDAYVEASYQAVRASGLEEYLASNRELDELAAEFGHQAQKFIDEKINQRLTEIEAAKRAA